jgi:hypothetical protein
MCSGFWSDQQTAAGPRKRRVAQRYRTPHVRCVGELLCGLQTRFGLGVFVIVCIELLLDFVFVIPGASKCHASPGFLGIGIIEQQNALRQLVEMNGSLFEKVLQPAALGAIQHCCRVETQR